MLRVLEGVRTAALMFLHQTVIHQCSGEAKCSRGLCRRIQLLRQWVLVCVQVRTGGACCGAVVGTAMAEHNLRTGQGARQWSSGMAMVVVVVVHRLQQQVAHYRRGWNKGRSEIVGGGGSWEVTGSC